MPAHHAHGTLGIDTSKWDQVLDLGNLVSTSLKAAAAKFPALSPPIAQLDAEVKDLDAAGEATKPGGHGLVSDREAKSHVVVLTLKAYLAYVNILAAALPYDKGVTLVEEAGFSIPGVTTRRKDTLAASQPGPSARIELDANVSELTAGMGSHAVTFHWRYTLDKGQTHVYLVSTPTGRRTCPAFAQGTTVGFEVCASMTEDYGTWSKTTTYVCL